MEEIIKPKKPKKRKQKMFVLYGGIDYESGNVLGVFSTNKRAEKARDADKGGYDSYDIMRFEVDALR